jgi:ABC-type dipeptide/oligopeptide/nickel transport system ATPase component
VNDPRIIFADEPTGNLDTGTGAVVEDILFSLNREHGITLIIVTHDEDLAARCDRRLVIRDGLLVEDVRNERAPHHHAGQHEAGQEHAGKHHAGRHLAAGSEEAMSA